MFVQIMLIMFIVYLLSVGISALIHAILLSPIPDSFTDFIKITFLPYVLYTIITTKKDESKDSNFSFI